MRLEIYSFKSHFQKSFDFSASNITLISGESGIGKTTILESIQWVLYGTGDDIHDKHGRSSQCKVTLYLSEICIFRQSRPNLLQVKINTSFLGNVGQVYEDQVAQNIINQLYGDNLAWKATSYIEQRYLCDLVSGTNRDKLNLIGKFAFKTGDNPEEVITKLAQEIKAQDQKITYNEGIITAQQNEYTRKVSSRNIDYSQQLTDESLAENKNLLFTNQFELQKLTAKRDEQNIIKGKQQNLLSVINNKKYMLQNPNYREITTDELNNLDNMLITLNEQLLNIPMKVKTEIALKKVELQIKIDERDQMKLKLEQLQNSLQNSRLNLQELNMKKETFDKQLNSERSVLLPYQQTLSVLQNEILKLKSDVNSFEIRNKDTLSNIPIVKKSIDDMKLVLQTKQMEQEKLKLSIQNLEQQIVNIINFLNNDSQFDKNWLQYNLTVDAKNKYILLSSKYEHNANILKEFNLKSISEVNILVSELIKKKEEIVNINRQITIHFRVLNLQSIKQQYLCNTCKNILGGDVTKNVCKVCNISLLQSELDTIKLNLNQAHKSKDILKCPRCENGIRYVNGNLIVAENSSFSETQIAELHQQLTVTESKISNLNTVLNSIRDLDVKISTLKNMITIDVEKYITKEDQVNKEGNQGVGQESKEGSQQSLLSKNIDFKDVDLKIQKLNTIHFQLESLIPLHIVDQLISLTKLKQELQLQQQKTTTLSHEINSKISNINTIEIKLVEIEQVSAKNLADLSEVKESLVIKENNFKNKQDELQKLTDDVTSKTKLYSENLNQLNNNISEMRNVINNVEKEITTLNLTYTNLCVFITNMDKQLNEQEINMITQQQNLINNQINSTKQNIQFLNSIKDNRNNLIKEIDNLQVEIDSLVLDSQIENLYLQKKEYCDQMINYIDYIKYHLEMKALYGQIMKKQEEMNLLRRDGDNLRKLKKIAVDLECQQIEFAVKLINERLATFLNEIFSDQISAKIMLYEKLKSSKRIVPKVNLKVTLKNVEYNKLSSLSWGEKDRISFALIMALSTINPSPVIMFDETFASLNKERIEICLTALKYAARMGKTVIITGHEQTGSYCDNIIKLE